GYSVAVRRQDGEVRVIKDALLTVGEKWPAFKLPFLRGVGVLGQALTLGIKALKFSADEAIKEETDKKEAEKTTKVPESDKTSSWLMAGNLVLALGVNILLFVVLPLFLTREVQTRIGFHNSLIFNAVDGVFRVGMFIGFLAVVSRMRDMMRVFQ